MYTRPCVSDPHERGSRAAKTPNESLPSFFFRLPLLCTYIIRNDDFIYSGDAGGKSIVRLLKILWSRGNLCFSKGKTRRIVALASGRSIDCMREGGREGLIDEKRGGRGPRACVCVYSFDLILRAGAVHGCIT